MRFVVIRHGQSENNLLYEQTGDSVGRHHDPALTELGHTQAARLAQTVADGALPWDITQIHTSLMTRAVQTAAPLADALDLPLHGHVDAYEIGGPFVEDDEGVRTHHRGATAEELQLVSERLVLPTTVEADGWFPGPYEDGDDLAAVRARRLVAGLREEYADDEVIALVTHGAFFQQLFRALLEIDAMTGWIIKHNTAVTLFEEIEVSRGTAVLAQKIDWMPHLSDDLVSI